MNKHLAFVLSLAFASTVSALTVNFDTFALEPDSHQEGPVPEGKISIEIDPFGPDSGQITTIGGAWLLKGGVRLINSFSIATTAEDEFVYSVWDGFAAANIVDTETLDYNQQYSSYAGGGASETGETIPGDSYGVYFAGYSEQRPAILFPNGLSPQGLFLTNTTYTALSIAEGYIFSRAFEQGDWFQVSLIGYDSEGNRTGEIIIFLADYRSVDPNEHYVLDEWGWVDLRSLGTATRGIGFQFYSSDNGDFGINTPTYVAIDNIHATPTRFADAEPLISGWNFSNWFGYYNDESFPWVFHNNLGWIWIGVSENVDETSLYLERLNAFVWTEPTIFPWLYRFSDGAWLYYFKGSSSPAVFYNSATASFEEFDR